MRQLYPSQAAFIESLFHNGEVLVTGVSFLDFITRLATVHQRGFQTYLE